MTARRRATEGIANAALPSTPFVVLPRGALLDASPASVRALASRLAPASIELAPRLADTPASAADHTSARACARELAHVRGRDVCASGDERACRTRTSSGRALELGPTQAEAW